MNPFLSIKNRSKEFLYNAWLFPKNLYVNFKVLPFNQAKKMPIFIGLRVQVKDLSRDSIIIETDNIYKKMITIGRGGSDGIAQTQNGLLSVQKNGQLIFKGPAYFHSGARIWIGENSQVVIGKDFSANKNLTLFYEGKMSIDDECMIGWNVEIVDGNGHTVIENGVPKSKNCNINIGSHVWIGANVKISRSVTIGDNSIIAYGSTVTGGFFENNTLLGGYPAKKIKSGINWEK